MQQKIDVHGVPETMLQTLYARAQETRTGRGLVRDDKAVELVEKIDYDFSKAASDRTMSTGVVARTILLDRMTRTFLQAHPDTTVLNLACGLDTRCYRMEGLYARWYNLDLPETMQIRRTFLPESGRIRQISCSATDPVWTEAVEEVPGPVLVIMEGLTMYLSQQQVQQIFSIVHCRFPHATVFVETMNPWIVRHVKEKSIEGSAARFTWGISGSSELQKLVPPFHSVEDRSLVEGMQVWIPVYRLLGKIGFVRKISNQILVLES